MSDTFSRQQIIGALKICDCNYDGAACKGCPIKDENYNGSWFDEYGNCWETLMHQAAELLSKESERKKGQRLTEVSKIQGLTQEDFGTLAICAVRYCRGRQTYMPDLVRSIVVPRLPDLSDKDLAVMIDDCRIQEDMSLFGDNRIDKPGWILWRELLLTEKHRREGEGNGRATRADD